MTAQLSDSTKYHEKYYCIAGKNGVGLFDPSAYDMKPVSRCSACWRGFVCSYVIEKESLLLNSLAICLDEPAPTLFGVSPEEIESDMPIFDAFYNELGYRVLYTGGLLLASDFIQEMYVHMGFHPAWKYREVYELVFHNGNLVQEMNRSMQAAELRQKLGNEPLKPGESAKDMMQWIEQCFSQEYKW